MIKKWSKLKKAASNLHEAKRTTKVITSTKINQKKFSFIEFEVVHKLLVRNIHIYNFIKNNHRHLQKQTALALEVPAEVK